MSNDGNHENVIWPDLHYLTDKCESNRRLDHYHLVVERHALLSYLSALSLLHWSWKTIIALWLLNHNHKLCCIATLR